MKVFLLLALLLGAPAQSNPTPTSTAALAFIAADDAKIQYTGRWEHANPVAPWSAWQGSSITVHLNGTRIEANLDVGNSTEWFRVIVDGNHQTSRKLTVTPGRKWVTLAGGLSVGQHRIDLVKETYAGRNITFHGLRLRGTGLATPPPRPPHRIEFYGDSNLAGTSNESEKNGGQKKLVGVHFGFSGVLARMLDAEYHNISAGGETLNSMSNRYDRMQRYNENPNWDFQRYRPEVVIINLGANDVGAGEAQIKARYHTFLDQIRLVHPTAHIVLTNGVGWSFEEPANYTDQVVAARQDPNLSLVNFPWVFEQWHGCQTDQAGMARIVGEHIGQVMSWSVTPPDVLDGYARNGNIANGSFEEVAPFGGYAWRYVENSKTERLTHQVQAKDGTAFVRMRNGGSIQQTHPAQNGNTMEVSLWMRGSGILEVTWDFRNQELYTVPLDVQSTQVTLSPQWQELRFSATAPLQTAQPVFATRLTIKTPGGSVADVDLVKTRRL